MQFQYTSTDLENFAQNMMHTALAKNAELEVELKIFEAVHSEVSVRQHEPETLEKSHAQGFSISVYDQKRVGSASSADLSPTSIEQTIERAYQMAQFSQADPMGGIIDPQYLASKPFVDVDVYHPYVLNDTTHASVDAYLLALAHEMEQTIYQNPATSNTDGCGGRYDYSHSVLANSHGFVGYRRGSMFGLWAHAIAGAQDAMQSESWSSQKRCFDDLDDPKKIASIAAQHAAARLNPRPLSTRKTSVIFIHYVVDELIGYTLDALSGYNQYHKSGFLSNTLDKKIMPDFISIHEDPWLIKGIASRSFDSAGAVVRPQAIIKDGRVCTYLLNHYFAKKLGCSPTGHNGGTANIVVKAAAPYAPANLQALMQAMGTGLLITDIMHPGFNEVNGDYSKGVSGFWIENGEIAYPVEGVTVADNLLDMYSKIRAIANDGELDSVTCGSMWVDDVTVGGV